MIQTAFGGMIAFMMAKFIINDLPHAAGLAGTSMKTMYHTALLRNWEKIRQEGLLPEALAEEVVEATGLKFGVYLEENLENAYGWASMLAGWELPEEGEEPVTVKFVVLEVEIPEGTTLTVDPDVIDIGGEGVPTAFIASRCIPPNHIRMLSITEVEVG